MSICSLITEGQDCTSNIPGGGTEARVLVLNHSDILGTTEASSVITDLVRKSGTEGFFFNGYRNDVKATEEVITPGAGANMFKHGSGFTVYGRTQAVRELMEKLARGKFIFVVENIGKDAGSFELMGLKAGLSMVSGVIRDAHNNNGLFVVTFSTMDSDGNYEPKLPQTVWDTDYGTTLALVESWAEASS